MKNDMRILLDWVKRVFPIGHVRRLPVNNSLAVIDLAVGPECEARLKNEGGHAGE